jgi:N-hydroxyarylamine O-acetyltransferase
MDAKAYLQRISLPVTPSDDLGTQYPPTLETLRILQAAAATNLPFENLDISIRKRKITLETESILNKVVAERRGGFCFELNGSFFWLLTQLGFTAFRVSARIWRNGAFGRTNTHMAIVVELDGSHYLVDVSGSHLTPCMHTTVMACLAGVHAS